MATKRPLCIYGGNPEELRTTDSLPVVNMFSVWKILFGETISIGDRQEYLIGSGILDCRGTLSVGSESIVIVRA